jgi:hypothetical protein
VGAALGASLARNLIGHDADGTRDPLGVHADVSDSTLTAGGALSAIATSNQTIGAIVDSGSAAISGAGGVGVSLGGAGAVSLNRISTDVRAYIAGSATTSVTAASVALSAQDTSSIDAEVGAIALTVAISGIVGGVGFAGRLAGAQRDRQHRLHHRRAGHHHRRQAHHRPAQARGRGHHARRR